MKRLFLLRNRLCHNSNNDFQKDKYALFCHIVPINAATETEAVTENRDSSEESEALGETIAMPVITEDTEEQSSENFVPDAEKDETDVKGENSFRKIKICLSKIKSFLEEEDDEEDSDEDEEASNECEVIPFKSKEDSDEK